jgi:hypothetical protein
MADVNNRFPPNWQLVPLREFPHLYALKNETGEVIATVHSEHAQDFQALPELLAASEEIFERLRSQYSGWGEQSSLGRLERAIALFKPPAGRS